MNINNYKNQYIDFSHLIYILQIFQYSFNLKKKMTLPPWPIPDYWIVNLQ